MNTMIRKISLTTQNIVKKSMAGLLGALAITLSISSYAQESFPTGIVGCNVGTWRAASLQEKITIDISYLASGMYFFKINNKTVKFIKE